MRIEGVALYRVSMPMKEPFVASHGTETDKHAIIVEVRTHSGAVGFAECVASLFPHYTEETTNTAWHMLGDWLIPGCMTKEFANMDDIACWAKSLHNIRGNRMAKAGIEMAIWDAYAAEAGKPLVDLFGATKPEVPVGISIGLQPTIPKLLEKVAGYVEQGFQRVKLKIEPGRDKAWVRAVRREFPGLPIMVDANSAYADVAFESLRWLDELDLMMVEQPLAHDDLIDHASLQRRISTAICLDESIRSAADLTRAHTIGACRVVNVKAGRVGGFGEVVRMHETSLRTGMDLWCGGMLETGIGRLHNIAISALPSFTIPGDTAPSARYFDEDLIDPPVEFCRPGWLPVEPLCGVADRVRRDRMEKWTVQSEVWRA